MSNLSKTLQNRELIDKEYLIQELQRRGLCHYPIMQSILSIKPYQAEIHQVDAMVDNDGMLSMPPRSWVEHDIREQLAKSIADKAEITSHHVGYAGRTMYRGRIAVILNPDQKE